MSPFGKFWNASPEHDTGNCRRHAAVNAANLSRSIRLRIERLKLAGTSMLKQQDDRFSCRQFFRVCLRGCERKERTANRYRCRAEETSSARVSIVCCRDTHRPFHVKESVKASCLGVTIRVASTLTSEFRSRTGQVPATLMITNASEHSCKIPRLAGVKAYRLLLGRFELC